MNEVNKKPFVNVEESADELPAAGPNLLLAGA
jgi:hypothetical protein